VVPPELVLGFDCRVATDVDPEKLAATFDSWCKEAGPGTYIEFTRKDNSIPNTRLDESNPYWLGFKNECAKM
jgi:aminoacylase